MSMGRSRPWHRQSALQDCIEEQLLLKAHQASVFLNWEEMVTHTCPCTWSRLSAPSFGSHLRKTGYKWVQGAAGTPMRVGTGSLTAWVQRHGWEPSQRAAVEGSVCDWNREICRLGLALSGRGIECIWGFGSEFLSRASPGSYAGIALTKHLPGRENPTGNLQDFGAKSYRVFCKVRSLKSRLSFGGHRGWLLTANKTVAKQHCCQIPNGPALLGPHPPRCWKVHPGFAGLFAPRGGSLPGSAKLTPLQLELFQSKQIDVTWFSWNLVESFTTWWLIFMVFFLT